MMLLIALNLRLLLWTAEIFQRIRQEITPKMAYFISLRVFNGAVNSSDYIASNDRKGYGRLR